MKSVHRLRLVIIFLSIALLVSTMLNWFLFIQGKEYYLQLNETRLDPLGLEHYPSENRQNITDHGKTSVVFFGDSRVAYWPAPPNLPQFQFINRGIGAQTSAQTVQRFDYHVKPLAPQIIIVQICINDLKTIPLFPTRKETIIAKCKENIQNIVTQSIDIGAIVILTTLFPIGKVPIERKLFWSSDVAKSIDEVNGYIYSLQSPNVIIFDTYSILADKGVAQDKVAQDLLHLNRMGYDALNRELGHILTNIKYR